MAGWDYIDAKPEAYVFIMGKTGDFARKTVAITWISTKYKNLRICSSQET